MFRATHGAVAERSPPDKVQLQATPPPVARQEQNQAKTVFILARVASDRDGFR